MSAVTEMIATAAFKNEIAARMGEGIDSVEAEKFRKMFVTAVNKDPKLSLTSKQSIAIAAYNLSELKLSPISAHAQAYLIPRGNECQLQISYRGLMTIAMRDGIALWITAELVYKGEKFKCSKGTENIIEHEIDFFADIDRSYNNIVGGYACAKLANGSIVFILMSIQQLKEHQKRYAPSGNAWTKSPEEMMKKTLIKRLCKSLPVTKSSDLLRAVEIDNEAIEMKNIAPENKAESVVDSIKNDLLGHDTTVEDFFNEEDISHEKIMENPDKFAVIKETGEIITIDKAIKITLEEQIDAYIMIIKDTKTLPELDEAYKKYYKILTKTAGLEQRHFKSLTDAADLHKAKLQELI